MPICSLRQLGNLGIRLGQRSYYRAQERRPVTGLDKPAPALTAGYSPAATFDMRIRLPADGSLVTALSFL